MITAILGALVTFGGFSTNLSNYPRFYENTVSVDVYYDINKTYSNVSSIEVMHFHDHVIYTVDFEKDDEGIHVFFRDCEVRTYYITNWETSETLIGSSTAFYDDIGYDGTLLLPNDDDYHSLEISHQQFSYSGTTVRFVTGVSWYDETLDSGAGTYYTNTVNVNNTINSGFFRDNVYRVSLSNLYKTVNYAFGSAEGGYVDGYNVGYRDGSSNGYSQGYNTGYAEGYTNGVSTDTTAFTIFNGILSIGMIPINAFLAMLNFTVLGINISNFVMSLLTVLITIWVVRVITGGGHRSD